MKKFLVLLLAALMAIAMAGCSPSAQTSANQSGNTASTVKGKSSKPKKDWKIAVVVKDSTNSWFVRMNKGVEKYAKETGINAFQKGPSKTDAAMQVQVIQDLIAQHVDAICVDPVDIKALEPVVGQAMKAGIVVITHEGDTEKNTMYDIEAFNNDDYGKFIMDNLAKAMGESGTYTTMVGNVTNATHNEWADAGVSEQKSKYPNMQLLAAQPRVESNDDLDTAYNDAKELLKKYPNLKGIMGTSSLDAPGVAKAIEELGLKGKVFVSGTGLVSQCKQYLEDGTIQSVTLWDPADAGYAMCSIAAKILNGDKIAEGLNLGIKGYDSMHLKPGTTNVFLGDAKIVINKDNMSQYDF